MSSGTEHTAVEATFQNLGNSLCVSRNIRSMIFQNCCVSLSSDRTRIRNGPKSEPTRTLYETQNNGVVAFSAGIVRWA